MSSIYKTRLPECVWPAVPHLAAQDLLAHLFQLEYSQWLPPSTLLSNQLSQLDKLLTYIKDESPFYRERFSQIGGKMKYLRELPLLTRNQLAEQGSNINCKNIPPKHLPFQEIQTSGSTGQTVKVMRTTLNTLMWMALSMRDHLWHRRDFSQTLAIIRANVSPQDDEQIAKRDGWGAPATLLFETGPSYRQSLSLSVTDQVKWLLRRNPYYLLTYPTNLKELLHAFERLQVFPSNLKEIRGVGETFSPEIKVLCAKFDLKVVDIYSAQEVGVIALQCPVSGFYHIQSESLLVEILDDAGNPCSEGQIGKVVITDLHNFATPIIRYEIRDYARVGGQCPCGRGLPVLTEILGRRRNMVTLPNGSKHWPAVGFTKFSQIAFIQQYQLIQIDLHNIEVKLVTKEKLSEEQEKQLIVVMWEALGYPFTLKFNYFTQELPKTVGGKFEEFISLVDVSSTKEARKTINSNG